MPMTREEIEQKVAELKPWFHDMNLGGVQTAPEHFLPGYPETKFVHFRHIVPGDLAGKSVLDIGCNGGFYSMEMKRRGADRVVGIDHDPRYLAQARLAAEVTGLDIEFRQLEVYEVAALRERFDLVIFMGVLYHLRHPLLALDLIHEHVAGDLLLFQTLQRGKEEPPFIQPDYDFFDPAPFDDPGFPELHFIESRFAHDPTNWFFPNAAASAAMLRSAGFEIIEHPEAEVYLCRRKEGGYPAPKLPS